MTAATVTAPASMPLYATRRDPSAPSTGARVGVIAAALGTPLMPWQQLVADVAGERHPDRPDQWRYQTVIVTVPRQAGKTTLLRAVALERGVSAPRRLIFSTAQTGKDARERWKDMVSAVESSPLGSRVTVRRGAGAESLILPNGSEVRTFAPVPKALHGYTPHMVALDEVWAFDAAQGEDLDAAIHPAQVTLADRQRWYISTAGTSESAYLRALVDAGRAAVDDPTSRIAYFEWAAGEEFDTYDEAGWLFHPALGHTIGIEDLRAAAQTVSRGNFERSYLNRWTVTDETVLDMDRWAEQGEDADTERELAEGRAFGYGYSVAADRSSASIWGAYRDEAGHRHYRVVLTKPGSGWLATAVTELHRARPDATIGANGAGPARHITDELKRDGVQVRELTAGEYATACEGFVSAFENDRSHHDRSAALTSALRAAKTRPMGDGGWAWSHKHSTGPIDPVEAATVAGWLADRADTPIQIF